jgi:predicted nucleic acid-binding protein
LNAVLVDSDVIIEVLRAHNRLLLARWSELAKSELLVLCSPVTIAELWHGVRAKEESAVENMFASITCVPVDTAIGRTAGNFLRKFSKSHSVELGDALIAATAIIHNVPLWTRNSRHFPMPEISFY